MNQNQKICYWSIGSNHHSYMVQSLINSKIKYGISGDFIAFTDKNLSNCINENLDSNIQMNLSNYMFKFQYLYKLLKYDYEYFIFLDADSIFVKESEICPVSLLNGDPWHIFLESPINLPTTKRPDWWGVPVKILTEIFREMGVTAAEIRNVNAGYWICKKEFIHKAYQLGAYCYKTFREKGFKITEEIPMSYIANYISKDVQSHFHEKYAKYWASDWTGVYKNQVPYYKEWECESYMTGEKFLVSPCLIHAMRSKPQLISLGKNS
jgi:hypothetical protein